MADLVARIAELWRYPVKSCAGEAVDTLQLDADGWPVGDRAWGIADASGELTWMGAHPRLALVGALLHENRLILQAQGSSLNVALDAGEAVGIRGWNGERQDFDPLEAWDAGDEAAELLHATTGERLRLVRLSLPAQRRAFLNALHIVGDGSLQAWQQAVDPPLAGATQRARPNIVLQAVDGGELQPFIEDILIEARVGSLTLRRTNACERCIMTTVDPVTGQQQPPALEALTRLSAERAPGAAVRFGIYVQADGAGTLRVGDRLALIMDFGELTVE